MRERFPEVRVVEQENRGLAAGWNEGVRCAGGRYVLLLNADAWLEPGAAEALVRFADEHPEAAVVGPRLLNADGSLQRSVRGFPTVWRLATEYAFLRKLGPRTRLFNAFYGAGFEHDEVREAEFVMGACLLVRARRDRRGRARRRGLLPLQRGDRLVPTASAAPAGRCCSSRARR